MNWQIYWDNGDCACGILPSPVFDNEEEADAYALELYIENIFTGVWAEEAECFPVVELPDNVEEVDAVIEESMAYFDQYIAGDK